MPEFGLADKAQARDQEDALSYVWAYSIGIPVHVILGHACSGPA